MNLNTVPKLGPPGGPIFGTAHRLVKEQKKSTFTVPFLGPSGGTKNETIAKSTAKADPCNEQKMKLRLVKQQDIELEQRRPTCGA